MEHTYRRWALLLLWLCLPPALADDGIFRWHDAAGQLHFGDHPPAHAQRVVLPAGENDRHLYRVRRIFDGDTVELEDGTHVRLLGIDAPEVAHREREAQPFGDAATAELRRLIGGHPVRLGYGPEHHDHYGRLLARLYAPDGKDLDLAMVAAGLAHVEVHPPNLEHLPQYFKAEAAARAAGRGIWSLSAFAVRPAEQAGHLLSGFHRLRGRVLRTYSGRHYAYIEFSGGLRALLEPKARAAFERAGHPIEGLTGRTLTVRGWLHRYRGRPELWLLDPLQVERFE